MKLTKRQKQALQILVKAERPLRNKDFHERFENGGPRTTGWSEALGPCTKPRDHDPASLRAQGLVTVVGNLSYSITKRGIEVAHEMGFEVIHAGPPPLISPLQQSNWPPKSRGDLDEAIRQSYSAAATPHKDHAGSNELANDVTAIFANTRIGATEKESLIFARLGQGAFRDGVLKRWNKCCSVTGSSTLAAIRASHIKPWCESTDEQRLDTNNGLPLIASLDALFDVGLISFDSTGRLMVSPKLDSTERQLIGVENKSLRKKPSAITARYLEYHRNHKFCQ